MGCRYFLDYAHGPGVTTGLFAEQDGAGQEKGRESRRASRPRELGGLGHCLWKGDG